MGHCRDTKTEVVAALTLNPVESDSIYLVLKVGKVLLDEPNFKIR